MNKIIITWKGYVGYVGNIMLSAFLLYKLEKIIENILVYWLFLNYDKLQRNIIIINRYYVDKYRIDNKILKKNRNNNWNFKKSVAKTYKMWYYKWVVGNDKIYIKDLIVIDILHYRDLFLDINL